MDVAAHPPLDDLGSSSPLSQPTGDDYDTPPPPDASSHRPSSNAPLNGASSSSASAFQKNNPLLPGPAPGVGGGGGGGGGYAAPVPRKYGPRKKKEESSANPQDGETKPQRKPRKPRDPNAPPRKRQKKSDEPPAADPQQKKPGFGLTGAAPPSANPTSHNVDIRPSPAPALARLGNGEAEQKPIIVSAPHAAIQAQPRPLPSGQRYDPIRSAYVENARPAKSPTHARASPSIASLIDRPYAANGTPPHHITSAPRPGESDLSKPSSPTPAASVRPSEQSQSMSNGTGLHPEAAAPESSLKGGVNGKSASPSRASSPKPARKKREAPDLPPGNGLLSGSDFGKPDASDKAFAEVPNQCIVIEVPITGESNNYINFIKEVETKYGFDVAHPRLAEHRRRMAQMAAAGAAIESGAASADDMALDGSDVDSNVEMGGVDEESSAGDGTKKKTRARRGDEYDKNDDFIDDTEQAWEEQALASRDGYFVWSGPLVPEGDKPAVERADGTVRRGRGGRGRGGGARGEGSSRGRTVGARRGGTGGGRGSRGGATGTTRKARLTKAEKEEMEQEKAERQKLAASLARPAIPQGIIGM